jgi:hypothetical protein
MVLILAISVLGIVGVTNWGLPAITQMQANVQTRQVQDEFHTLDTSLAKLIASTTGQATYKWQPGISQGSIVVNGTSDRWLVASDAASWVNVTWSALSDTNNAFAIRTNQPINSFNITAYRWSGGAATALKVSQGGGNCDWYAPSTASAGIVTLGVYTNTTGCNEVPLTGSVFTFKIRGANGAGSVETVHQAYLAEAGSIRWTGAGTNAQPVYHSNGAVYAGGQYVSALSLPSVPPPRNFTNSTGVNNTGLFVRLITYHGNASFSAVGGGAERSAIYLNFQGTYTLGSSDNITSASIYQWGLLRDATYAAMTDLTSGYRFATQVADGETFLRQTEGGRAFQFSVVYSQVEVQG